MINNSNHIKKFYKILIAILIFFLIGDILNATYVALWQIHSLGMEPLYGIWLQSLVPDLLLVLLLLIKRLQALGVFLDFCANLSSLIFLYQTSNANPFAWIKAGRIQWGVSIILQLVEMLICLLCLFLWWKLRIEHTRKK